MPLPWMNLTTCKSRSTAEGIRNDANDASVLFQQRTVAHAAALFPIKSRFSISNPLSPYSPTSCTSLYNSSVRTTLRFLPQTRSSTEFMISIVHFFFSPGAFTTSDLHLVLNFFLHWCLFSMAHPPLGWLADMYSTSQDGKGIPARRLLHELRRTEPRVDRLMI